MTTAITEEGLGDLLRTIRSSAFRLETLDAYALDYGRADFELFLAGRPGAPLWQEWLDQVAAQTRRGKALQRPLSQLTLPDGDTPVIVQKEVMKYLP